VTGVQQLAEADVLVILTADVRKLCPIKDEVDDGTVTITYRTNGQAFELHELAAHLATFTNTRVSHETFTAELAGFLGASVRSEWVTAGMRVRVESVPS
jgi:NADPH-dependent 7-cyano-7-deazaguanine reductase QueF